MNNIYNTLILLVSIGSTQCQFCEELDETTSHLFVSCAFVKSIWFWLRECQTVFTFWSSFYDILQFAMSLQGDNKQAFLIVVSAIFWTVWKHHNEICFTGTPLKTNRAVIFLIISLLHY